MTTSTSAYEIVSSTETAKHIRETLKIVYPGVEFSVKSNTYESLMVSWEDGPLGLDVKKVLNRFTSYVNVLSKSDFDHATPYEWKGDYYLGLRSLGLSRTDSS
jgi:hypothetical protein